MSDDVLSKLAAAHRVVVDLCSGDQRWIMSIPARPDRDPDLIIGSALREASSEITRLREGTHDSSILREQMQKERDEWKSRTVYWSGAAKEAQEYRDRSAVLLKVAEKEGGEARIRVKSLECQKNALQQINAEMEAALCRAREQLDGIDFSVLPRNDLHRLYEAIKALSTTGPCPHEGADVMIRAIEQLFPDWKDHRDLAACIQATLEKLKNTTYGDALLMVGPSLLNELSTLRAIAAQLNDLDGVAKALYLSDIKAQHPDSKTDFEKEWDKFTPRLKQFYIKAARTIRDYVMEVAGQ